MPKDNFTVHFDGLTELQESLNMKRINGEIAKGVGLTTKKVHAELKFEIAKKYNAPHSLDSVLIGRSTSNATFGKGVIEGGLEYRYKPVDLAKFPYSAALGNIPPLPKRQQGMVHSVSVTRGRKKVVYGKSGNGGFVPRKGKPLKDAKPIRNGRFGVQMFERKGKRKKPLRLLFGPSLTEMAERSLDSAGVKRAITDLEAYIRGVI